MSTKELPAQPIKGLIEGMTVLQQVASVRKPVSTLELAVQLGMEKTRVNRILKTLAYAGMVHRTSNRRYL
ncbi:MAG: transcriptional regulator, partial [Epsilonproteobacteria bacterium]